MKLLRTVLLIAFACSVGIALFLAGNLIPTLRFSGDWPSNDGPEVVLAAASSEDWIAAAEPDGGVDVGEAGATDAAEPSVTDALDTTTETPSSPLDGLVNPETYTITAEPDGSRVRMEAGDGTVLEADSIETYNSPPVATPDRAATHDNATYAAPADDNPIPEFLRGRELPRLARGEKVVTVPVPVERWLDLSEADIVQVSFTQAPADVIKTGRIASADGNFTLPVVARAEIYAMPQFAPAQRDTVPVCLKVSAKEAKELLALRNNPGRFDLTVVESAQATPEPRAIESGTTSEDPFPARTQPSDEDDFPPRAARPMLAEDALPRITWGQHDPSYQSFGAREFTLNVGQQLTHASGVAIQSISDFDPGIIRVTTNSARQLMLHGINPGRTAIRVMLVGDAILTVPVQVSGSIPGPLTFDERSASTAPTTSEPLPQTSPRRHDTDDLAPPPLEDRAPVAGPRDDRVDYVLPDADLEAIPATAAPAATPPNDPDEEESALPTIEPSEEGTVLALNGNPLHLALGATQIVECELRIQRVSGFDAKLIRVTPLTARRLKIEALAEGQTSFRVDTEVPRNEPMASSRFSVEVQVMNPLSPPGAFGRGYGAAGARPARMELRVTEILEPLENGKEYTVLDQSTVTLGTSEKIRTVDGFDKTVINVTALDERRLRITGVQPGQTTLHVKFDGEGEPVLAATVRVKNKAHDELERLLKKLYPQANVTVESVRESVLLHGTVTGEEDIREIIDIAQQYAAKVLNQLTVQAKTADAGQYVVTLSLPRDQVRIADATQEVDLYERREIADSGRVELNMLIQRVRVIDRTEVGPNLRVTLRGTERLREVLSEVDESDIVIWTHAETASPRSAIEELQPSSSTNRHVPVVVTNSEDELRQLPSGERVHLLLVTRPPLESALDAKMEQLIVADAPVVEVRLRGGEKVVVFDLTAEQAGAVVQSGEQPLTIQRLQASGEPSAAHVPDATTAPSNPQDRGDPSLRDDIRALHDDVRKLIALLEKRAAVQPPAAEGLTPTAAARQAMFNEWGRAILRADYPRAVGVAETYLAQDPNNEEYKTLAEISHKANSDGSTDYPLLVVATAKWSGPCQHVQPLLTRLQNRTMPMVVLDADDKADAVLIEQLEIKAFPTLVVAVQGKKWVELAGVFNEAEFGDWFKLALRAWAEFRDANARTPGGVSPPDTAPDTNLDDLNSPPAPPAAAPTEADREGAAFLQQVWWQIGVRFSPASPDSQQLLTFFVNGGLQITEVRPDSPVAKAGLQAGDVLLGVQRWETTDGEDLRYALNDARKTGLREMTFHLIRDEQRAKLQVVLDWDELESPPHGAVEPDEPANPPETAGRTRDAAREAAAFRENVWRQVGFRFTLLAEGAAELQGFTRGGLIVDEVRPDSPMAKAHVIPGDVLIGLHDSVTWNADHLRHALDRIKADHVSSVRFHLLRDRERRFELPLELPDVASPAVLHVIEHGDARAYVGFTR